MKHLLTCFCFEPGSLTGKDVALFARDALGFNPDQAKLQRRTGPYTDALWKRLEATEVAEVRLQTKAFPSGPYFQVMLIGTWRFQAVYWRVPSMDVPSLAVLEHLTEQRGFNAGYRCVEDDPLWQSQTSVAIYEQEGRSHQGLPKVADRTFGGAKIDISGNPGRRTPFPGMWLQSCWQMWFGRGAFERLPVSRLRDFKGAAVTKTLASGAVFIQLYEDALAYDLPENRRVQARFRDWSGMDELETRALDEGGRRADPSFEVREGTFPHGGVRLLTEWRDAHGGPSPRSRAVERIDVELGPTGLEVWSERRRVQ